MEMVSDYPRIVKNTPKALQMARVYINNEVVLMFVIMMSQAYAVFDSVGTSHSPSMNFAV